MDIKKAIRNANIVKAAAAVTAIAVIAVSSMLPAKAEPAVQMEDPVLNPAPVVMNIETMDDAVTEEESEAEEQKRKLSFFTKLKLAIYGFFAACAAWTLHKIPWKKIFTRRNLFLALLAVALLLTVYYVGLPALEEYLRSVQ